MAGFKRADVANKIREQYNIAVSVPDEEIISEWSKKKPDEWAKIKDTIEPPVPDAPLEKPGFLSQLAENIKQDYINRYTKPMAALRESPILAPLGYASDIATAASLGGGLLPKVGLTAAGAALKAAAPFIDPVSLSLKGLGRIMGAPFKASVVPETVAAMEREGITAFPSSAVSTSSLVKKIEGTVSYFTPIADKIQAKLNSAKIKVAENFTKMVSELNGKRSFMDIGESMDAGLTAVRESFLEADNALWEKARLSFKEGKMTIASQEPGLVPLGTKAFDVVDLKNAPADLSAARSHLEKTFEDYIKTGELPVEITSLLNDLKKPQTMDWMWSKIKVLNGEILKRLKHPFLITGNEGRLLGIADKMRTSFMNSLENFATPGIKAEIEAANKFYATGMDLLNGSALKAADRFLAKGDYTQFDKLAKALVSPSMSEANINAMKTIATKFGGGAEVLDAFKASAVKQIYEKALKTSGEFDIALMGKEIKKWGPALKNLLGEEMAKKLADKELISGVLTSIKELGAVGRQRVAGSEVLGLGALAYFKAPAALGALLGILGSNRFIASQTGQAWLTTGLNVGKIAARGAAISRAALPVKRAFYPQANEPLVPESLAPELLSLK
ncbi:MAG TPA: hypothetical protein VJ000_01180 [Thermodesulfovibrionia bacterium]|nr:hypothetical protein [Thermodesulfovibrionia bacterium]